MASIKSLKHITAVPSLMDRLTERSPTDVSSATLERGELPELKIKEAICRDLGWLLNTTSLAATTDLSRWPQVRRSVLNFGVNVFSGRYIGNPDAPQIAATIKRSIETFEPRLRRETLRVNAISGDDGYDQREIRVSIEAEYVDHGQLHQLTINLRIDAETGRLQFVD